MIFIGYSLLTRIYNPLATFCIHPSRIPESDVFIMSFNANFSCLQHIQKENSTQAIALSSIVETTGFLQEC